MGPRWYFGPLLAVMAFGLIELVSFVGVRLIEARTRSAQLAGVFWNEAHFTDEEVEEAFANRDPVLGWPTKDFLASDRHDRVGARPSPAFPEPGRPCVAAFGDSFTYAQEVSDDDAWGNVLAKALGCRVANFGVPGYGVDQAYLRYGQKKALLSSAKVVVIGIFPENIMRHVNQYVGFRVARQNLLFKPRYVLDSANAGGELRLVPALAREDFDEDLLNRSPEKLLPHEFFLPDSRFGPVLARFPYTWALLRAILHPRVRAVLQDQPAWIALYAEETEPLVVTLRLLHEFAQDVRRSGKTPLVFVFTNADSVNTFERDGVWPYQRMLDFLEEHGVPTLHVGDRFAESFGAERVCSVFTRETAFGCTGHYTPEGYAIVADMIATRLREDGLFPARE